MSGYSGGNPMYESGFRVGVADAQAGKARAEHDDWPEVAQIGYADGYASVTPAR